MNDEHQELLLILQLNNWLFLKNMIQYVSFNKVQICTVMCKGVHLSDAVRPKGWNIENV